MSLGLTSPGMVLDWGWRMDTDASKVKIDMHMPKRTPPADPADK